MQRFLRPLFNLFIVAGLTLAAWPLGQNLYANWNQRELKSQFAAQEKTAPSQPTSSKSARQKSPAPKVINPKPTKRRAWPLTKLSIPEIGLETYVVSGWDDAALRRGPGHYPKSSFPGEGNCVIAGHRNVYGSPFADVDRLLPGQPIILENRDGVFVYETLQTFPTSEANIAVLSPELGRERPMLTLITCTLPHTSNRVILQAVLKAEDGG